MNKVIRNQENIKIINQAILSNTYKKVDPHQQLEKEVPRDDYGRSEADRFEESWDYLNVD